MKKLRLLSCAVSLFFATSLGVYSDEAAAAPRANKKQPKTAAAVAADAPRSDRASLGSVKGKDSPTAPAAPAKVAESAESAHAAQPAAAPLPAKAADKPTAKQGSDSTKLFNTDFNEAPTNITSDTLTLKSDKRVFVYSGNVLVTQGNMTLTCEELEGTYTEENEIDKLYAKRNVVITKTGETPDQLVKATAQHAVFDNKTQIATLTKSPQVEQNGSILTADLIKMYLEEDRSVAEGQVRVTLVQQPKAGGSEPKQGKKALLGAK